MKPARLERFARREFLLERDIYAAFLDLACEAADAGTAYLYVIADGGSMLDLVAVSPAAQALCGDLGAARCAVDSAGAWADCLRTGEPALYRGYPAAAVSPLPGVDLALKNHLGLPLPPTGEARAVLGIADRRGGIDADLVTAVSDFAAVAWPAVEQHRQALLRRRAQAAQREVSAYAVLEDVIRAVAGAVELREDGSARHQPNVAWLCDRLAQEIGMGDFERRGLAIGASLHDIGKIAVPSAVLAKPAEITADEFRLVQTHSEVGADLFRPLQLPWPVADMIAQHHERLDGSGYPAGLRRDDICEGARMIAIADTYDAMASDRPYRRARGTARAMEALREGRGTIFDGYLVDAFLRCALEDPGFGGRYSS